MPRPLRYARPTPPMRRRLQQRWAVAVVRRPPPTTALNPCCCQDDSVGTLLLLASRAQQPRSLAQGQGMCQKSPGSLVKQLLRISWVPLASLAPGSAMHQVASDAPFQRVSVNDADEGATIQLWLMLPSQGSSLTGVPAAMR